VVDPKMEGRVKITVIATGFDRPTASQPVAASAAQTPVDLQSYTARRQEAGELVAAAGGGGRISMARRPVLEMPSVSAMVDAAGEALSPGAEFEPASPLDVPAFLRRQSEA
jgi:hypothetical protein